MTTSSGSTTHALDAYRATGVSPGRSDRADLHLPDRSDGPSTVRYTVYGPPWAPPIVVLGGISADRHLYATSENPSPGWWGGVVGPGQVLDPARHRLIGIDYLSGSAAALPGTSDVRGTSDVPGTRDVPGTDDAPGTDDVPGTDVQARAIEAVLDREGIRRTTVVGASYGGMVALAFAALRPDRMERLVVLAAAHRQHPMATGLRSVQRSIVALARECGREHDGMVLARSLAMTTYRSAAEFEARFGAEEVERYLTARGRAFASRTSARHFLSLSASIDRHRIDPSAVRAPLTLISFDTDTLVPPWLMAELASRCGGAARHVTVPTLYGHDGFLKETAAVSAELADALGDGGYDGRGSDGRFGEESHGGPGGVR